ncbi:sugar ABC transporter substrate-binding protein [Martelella mediterranea]|uniref:ABC transporter substrate-binding protein n=1 Tax=Martelella mediterranea TaxID=293089 RepID=UPI001E594F3A|nr:sugar ABC transporter substrate-binding protein [Martelella mediterranea]MCD1635790.1 sugar ABC transporter substrate-binding protein [Martelella mediterranea]
MNTTASAWLRGTAVAGVLALTVGQAAAADSGACIGKVPTLRVLVQPTPSVGLMEELKGQFEDKWDTSVEFTRLGENERRAQERLDASTGAGAYQVYYLDEANVPEFADAGWILPILDYYPEHYDFDDFLSSRRAVGSWEGKDYVAPTMGGGDILFYRKDLFAEAGVDVPKTMDEMVAAAEALNQPPDHYGWANRGRRGSGMNVWTWIPFFKAYGGEWTDEDGVPQLNSEAAVKATETFVKLFDYAPPGGRTATFAEQMEGMRSGQVAMVYANEIFAPPMEDESVSSVVGKIGYAPPPSPLPSAGFGHGLGISAEGAKSECERLIAGEFIGWATSKEMETERIDRGITSDYARKSSLDNPGLTASMPPDFAEALKGSAPVTSVLFWRIPEWPTIGDELGLAIEELTTGTRTDVQASLDEVNDFAVHHLRRSNR